MKGTYFLGNGRFETREMKEMELLPDEVLVKVEACGVCGTDVHIYHGDKGSAEVHPPVILRNCCENRERCNEPSTRSTCDSRSEHLLRRVQILQDRKEAVMYAS